jgi:hypothetical protein
MPRKAKKQTRKGGMTSAKRMALATGNKNPRKKKKKKGGYRG